MLIVGEGEMADLIRDFDWSRTAVGSMEAWPDTLVTTVNMLIASRHPMFLWWGPDLIQFYNDAYRPSIRADKHPRALGQRGAECWPEIWPIIGPQIDSVMADGRATWNKDQLIPIFRDGNLEDVYWTYSYSPVKDKEGRTQGTLVVCSETTEQVLTERRLKTLLAVTAAKRSETEILQSLTLLPFAQEIIATLNDNADIPFAALYQSNNTDTTLLGVASTSAISRDYLSAALVPLLRAPAPLLVADLQKYVGNLSCGSGSEPITQAYVLPLVLSGSRSRAVFVFGINPRLPFDAGYETFFHLVGSRIAGLLQSEMQRLELAQAATRFQALAGANPFGMVIGTLNGELKYITPVLRKSLGYSEADVNSGMVRWDHLTPPEYSKADASAIEELRATGRCNVYEKIYLAKDGRRIPILIGASIIGSLGGEAEVATFVTELTPLKMAEQALQKANDELERKVAERTAALEDEVAERKRMEGSLRELTGRLLRTQDEERRHMARELHDNAGQTLAALTMNLSAIETGCSSGDKRMAHLASETRQLSDDLSREIRTLSYLLHPPLLDEIGLESALRWYVEGFSERSKIQVDISLPAKMERLPRELELVVFRVVQESLTNVHRHSGSPSAKIQLTRSKNLISLEISDRGKGISEEKRRELTSAKAGVGVRGMEERLRQFGGSLQIASTAEGTSVTASIPIAPPA